MSSLGTSGTPLPLSLLGDAGPFCELQTSRGSPLAVVYASILYSGHMIWRPVACKRGHNDPVLQLHPAQLDGREQRPDIILDVELLLYLAGRGSLHQWCSTLLQLRYHCHP
eukprot:GHUV01007039.1.p1 GENE.GHUV01007039.1~~GHUV01007039.1.p1  ORF type:complete len:111 (-),score=5.74 GHUV01007039.1:205-537(-)